MGELAPAFLFYARDWSLSTRGMSIEAKGVYIDLLAYAWTECGLPTDVAQIQRIAGCGNHKRWRQIWEELEPKWVSRDGRLVNDRQEHERECLRTGRARQSQAGQRSAATRRARYGTAQPKSERNAEPPSEPPSETSSNQAPNVPTNNSSNDTPNDVSNVVPNISSTSSSSSTSLSPKSSFSPSGQSAAPVERFLDEVAMVAWFELIYTAYPNKDRRNPAMDVWLRSERTHKEATLILENIKLRLAAGWVRLERRFIPTLVRFLTERQWEDMPMPEADDPWRSLPGSWQCKQCGDVHEGDAEAYRTKPCLKKVPA